MILKIVEGSCKGLIEQLDGEFKITIGRDEKCDITIDDVKSSRQHASIYSKGSKIFVEDLNSTNGLFVNEQIIFKKPLENGDFILIGETLIEVSNINPAPLQKEQNLNYQNTLNAFSNFVEDKNDATIILSSLSPSEADILKGEQSSLNVDELVLENNILRKICEISQIIGMKEDPQHTLISILDNMQEIFSADTACILNWDKSEEKWKIRATSSQMIHVEETQISMTIVNQAISDGIAILSSDTMSDNRFDPSMSIISTGVTSAVCSPLKINDEFHGLLFFDRRNSNEMFNSMDLRLTATVGNILGVYLEKEELEIQAKQKQRLVVIGEVIAGLAHYTKNIITGLKFSIDALNVVISKNKTDAIPRCLNSISMQEKRISDLVLNMLSYSKDRVPTYVDVDIKQLLSDLIEPYHLHFEKENIIVKTKFPEDDLKIRADEQSLHRVFLNLLVNALDSLKISNKQKKEIEIILKQKKSTLEVDFIDSGIGIVKEKLDKIFNVFFSTKGSEGTGLGLAVVCKIIEEHRGQISVDSQEGEWTKFTVTLPIK